MNLFSVWPGDSVAESDVSQGNERRERAAQDPTPLPVDGEPSISGEPSAGSDPAPQPKPEAVPETIALLRELQAEVRESVSALTAQNGQLEEENLRLRESLEAARADQVATLLAPPAGTLITLLSQVESAAATDYSEVPRERLLTTILNEFAAIEEKLRESLESLGFEEVEVNAGDQFDSKRHAAKSKSIVSVPEQHRTVNRVLRRGFTFVGARKVNFPATVVVNHYDSKHVPAEPSPSTVIDDAKEEN